MRNRANHFYEFGPYRLDPSRNLLRRGSETVPLTSKAFETLLVLIEHGDQIVSKEELMKQLWPDTFVEEANLAQHISMVRKALGETPQDRRYIITLPGRGYRFAERVRTLQACDEDSLPQSPGSTGVIDRVEPTVSSTRHNAASISFWKWLVATILASTLLAGGLYYRSRQSRTIVQDFVSHDGFAPAPKIMLAVLPFENLTGDPANDYFSDGLTEELITQLAELQPDQLGVIARTSVMSYKHGDRQVDRVATQLRVQYILEGSLRQSSGRVRISAQLIQVKGPDPSLGRELRP